MWTITIILFSISIIRLIIYISKSNRNPNKNNTTIKQYKFSDESKEFEVVSQIEELEKKQLKEFAVHHFHELKKINPLISVEDDFPENVFPKALKKILISEVNSDEDYIEAINSINLNFTTPNNKDL